MRLLVCGNLDFANYGAILSALAELRPAVVIEGEARGADQLPFAADWKTQHRAAGPIRNRRMLDEGKPDRALAFVGESPDRGTANMLAQCRKRGVPAKVIQTDLFET
jgi:hypothetical protein